MSDIPAVMNTATSDDGFSMSSTFETTEQLTESLKPEAKPEAPEKGEPVEKDDDLSEAASKLGKEGGKASAAKRAEQAPGQSDADKADDAPAANDPAKPDRRGNPRHDPTARVAEATRLAAEAKRERDAIKAERDRLAAELEAARKPATETKSAEAKATDPNRPKVEDFEKYEDYVEAVADYKAEQRLKQYQEHQQQREQFTARASVIDKAVSEYRDRIEEAKKADPDFLDKTAPVLSRLQPSFLRGPDEPLTQLHVISDEVLKSAQSAALLSHFADNPDVLSGLESLQSIPDIQAEIRFLAKGLTAAPLPTASKPEISKARPPVRPVTGAPVNAGGPDPDSENFDEWVEHYNAKEARRR